MTPELDVHQSALLTDLSLCVNYYRLFSPGLYVCTLAPVQLDDQTQRHPPFAPRIYGRDLAEVA